MGYLITSLNIFFRGLKKKGWLSFVIFSQMGDFENTFFPFKKWVLMLKWLTFIKFSPKWEFFFKGSS
jgi:hypothetical protein